MSEYIKRRAGGFYIVEDHRPRVPLLIVRRAVHQLIDPSTEYPFPEIAIEEQYARHLWSTEVNYNWSNEATPVELNEENLMKICVQLSACLPRHL